MKEMIKRKISKIERMIEIINTIPKPLIRVRIENGKKPILKILAHNENGVCLYEYKTSNSIGEDLKKLKEGLKGGLKVKDIKLGLLN